MMLRPLSDIEVLLPHFLRITQAEARGARRAAACVGRHACMYELDIQLHIKVS